MSGLLTYRGTVYPWHCDHMGHMNVMWYAGKFDEATWQLAGAIGLGARRMAEIGRGMVAAEQVTRYRAELLAGDLVEVTTVVTGLGERSLRFEHAMRNASTGKLAATCALVGVHIDCNTRRPSVFPADVREAIKTMLAPGWTSDGAAPVTPAMPPAPAAPAAESRWPGPPGR